MTGLNFYNEIDAYAAAWLRNLIAAGHIAPGIVDERSIVDIDPDELAGYTQCHFFAGIGGWSYALRLAGWPDDRPVWTGSCPCQPFSAAGSQRGSDDERHLWPSFFRLISERRPSAVFGEQVAGAAGLAWLDHVCADLEDTGYAAAAAALPACSVGAPHRRERLFWVAHAELPERRSVYVHREDGRDWPDVGRQETYGSEVRAVADGDETGLGEQRRELRQNGDTQPGPDADGGRSLNGGTGALADIESGGRGQGGADASRGDEGTRPQGSGRATAERAGSLDAWADLEWLQCSDGKARATQPGLFPLAHGVSNRVGRLRAYGNAIVPQVAAAFIAAADGA